MIVVKLLLACLLIGNAFAKPVSDIQQKQPRWNNRGQVVFLGDSITDWWRNDGKETWDAYYEPLGAVNTGVSGDRTTSIIDRINQGMIDNLNAYLAVLKIGTNDISGNVPEQTVADNIRIIINLIKEKNPGARVLLLGILPRGGEEIHGRCKNVNNLIAQFANESEGIWYLDMEAQFSTGVGQVVPNLYWEDQLHLSWEGYVMWAQTMESIFNQVLHRPFPAKVVWMGDSLSDQFDSVGESVWNEFYAPIQTLNLAISGHTSQNQLDRIEQEGVLNGLNPKVAILMVGGNDLESGSEAPVIVARIQRILQHFREKLPHARILLLGLLPAGGKPDWVIEQGKAVNDALSREDHGDNMRYLDMRNVFADEDENIYEELYQMDQTHLSLEGYKVWQANMDAYLQELLSFS